MPKTKILFFSHSSYLFGAENCLLSLVRSLDPARFESAVILPADGPLKQKLDELGVRNHVIPLEWWVKNEGRILFPQNELTHRLDQLLRVVAEEKPDVIHSNTSVVWLGAVAARLLGIPHVWHLHEMLVDHPSLEPSFPLPLLYQSIDFLSEKVVVVSEELRRELAGYAAPEKLQVVYNGIAPAPADADRSFRAELDAADRVIAVTVTSLQKYKGIDDLLAAAAQAVKARPEILFVIAGTGPRDAVAALARRVQELGIEDSVRYLGFRDDVPRILAGSDLFVLPSLKEAFPLVVLEAMAQGKPVIATDCGGTAEMVRDGETGYIVASGSPAELAEKIVELAGDPERIRTMGEAGRARFGENFTLDRYIRRFEQLYTEAAATTKAPLGATEGSLLSAFVEAYQGYSRATRTAAQFAELQDEAARLRQSLAEKEVRLNELAGQLQRSAGQQDELVARHRKEQAELAAQYRQEQAELDLRLQRLHEELACAGELRDELEKWVDQKSSEIVSRDERIRQITSEAARAREVRQDLEQRLQRATVELADRDGRIRSYEEELVHAGELRLAQENKLEQKRVALADLDARIRQIVDEVAREAKLVDEAMRAKDETIRGQNERLEAGAARLTETEKWLADLQAAFQEHNERHERLLAEKDRRIEDLLNSLSWKVTGPLRKVYGLLTGRK